MTKKFIFLFLFLCSCRNSGLYAPYTTSLEVPEGPPEYKAGWRAGCRTGLSAGGRSFYAGSFVFPNADYGEGNYHQDGAFVSGWLDAAFTCFENNSTWVIKDFYEGPLQ